MRPILLAFRYWWRWFGHYSIVSLYIACLLRNLMTFLSIVVSDMYSLRVSVAVFLTC